MESASSSWQDTSVELLDELYFAENKGWGFKSRCLRWIGPYFPGSDPASRERTALEQANHESNIKVVVLGASSVHHRADEG
jgi:hypothetical protein